MGGNLLLSYIYFFVSRNLNPFEVLQVDPDLGNDDMKKKFRVNYQGYFFPE